MAYTYVNKIVYWRFPDLVPVVCTMPPVPPGMVQIYDMAQPMCISGDGHVIAGIDYVPNGTAWGTAKWVDGVYTPIAQPVLDYWPGDTPRLAQPYQISQDGSVIYGAPYSGYGLGIWTGGGATWTVLPPAPPYGIMASYAYDVAYARAMSADGHTIAGLSAGSYPTYWIDGVPTPFISPYYSYGEIWHMSADGNTFAGKGYPGEGGGTTSGYWRKSTGQWRQCNMKIYPRFVNSNGTVIWHDSNNSDDSWTDQLDTVNGTTGYQPVYGVSHDVVVLANSQYQFVRAYAEDTFSPNPIAAGGCDILGGPYTHAAVKVTGINTVRLFPPAGYLHSYASGISGNGAIVSGNYSNPGEPSRPCYWDAANACHPLPIPPGWEDALNGTQTRGMSRDGSTIYGVVGTNIYTEDPTPPDPPPIALRLVALEPQALPDNLYNLYGYLEDGNDFPETFGQYSLSVWCCEDIEIRWPTFDPAQGLLRISPSQLYCEFRALDYTLLFSGTFINPGDTPKLYKISFAIDTQAQTVTCWGNNTKWTSTDATWHSAGDIGNRMDVPPPEVTPI